MLARAGLRELERLLETADWRRPHHRCIRGALRAFDARARTSRTRAVQRAATCVGILGDSTLPTSPITSCRSPRGLPTAAGGGRAHEVGSNSAGTGCVTSALSESSMRAYGLPGGKRKAAGQLLLRCVRRSTGVRDVLAQSRECSTSSQPVTDTLAFPDLEGARISRTGGFKRATSTACRSPSRWLPQGGDSGACVISSAHNKLGSPERDFRHSDRKRGRTERGFMRCITAARGQRSLQSRASAECIRSRQRQRRDTCPWRQRGPHVKSRWARTCRASSRSSVHAAQGWISARLINAARALGAGTTRGLAAKIKGAPCRIRRALHPR